MTVATDALLVAEAKVLKALTGAVETSVTGSVGRSLHDAQTSLSAAVLGAVVAGRKVARAEGRASLAAVLIALGVPVPPSADASVADRLLARAAADSYVAQWAKAVLKAAETEPLDAVYSAAVGLTRYAIERIAATETASAFNAERLALGRVLARK